MQALYAPTDPNGATPLHHQPDPVDVHVGRRVRHMRILQDLTQEELGERVGVSYQQIQKYETGANRISASKLYWIAVTFEVAPGWFFEGLAMADRAQVWP